MRQLFVSYSRNNLDAITQLIADLQAVGFATWHDKTLTGGQRWWDNILANIRQCDIFIFALSPESWDSEACKSELSYAVQLNKPILPVLIADGININLLSPPLNEIQVTDYRRRDREAGFALIKSINMVASHTAPLPDPLPNSPPVPVSYLSNLKERIDSSQPLNSQEQIALFFELEEGLREGRSMSEIRDLLRSMKRRDDLLAKVGMKIDVALKSLADKASISIPDDTGAEPPVPGKTPPNGGASNNSLAGELRLCPRCRAQVGEGVMFCGTCGAILDVQNGPKVLERDAGLKSRRYLCTPGDTPGLIADVKGWLDAQGFYSQQMNAESQGMLLRIKKRGKWRGFVGMATSFEISFDRSGDTLVVEVGVGKWFDKAVAGFVGLFLFMWPLAITAGLGAWEQMKMPEKVLDYIGTRLVYK